MINNEHPDFKKYKREYELLIEEMDKEISNVSSDRPHTKDGEYSRIQVEYAKKLKKLQAKFAHLKST